MLNEFSVAVYIRFTAIQIQTQLMYPDRILLENEKKNG